MVFTGPAARIPAEAPKHADAPSGARGIRAKANRIRVRRASLLFAASIARALGLPSPVSSLRSPAPGGVEHRSTRAQRRVGRLAVWLAYTSGDRHTI